MKVKVNHKDFDRVKGYLFVGVSQYFKPDTVLDVVEDGPDYYMVISGHLKNQYINRDHCFLYNKPSFKEEIERILEC
jgi:hypothetical protein